MELEELIAWDPDPAARRFIRTVDPGLADAAPGGRVRLDALARWLQDVAHADVVDAGLADVALWVVRRCRLRVERFPRFGEPATVTTFASGMGRLWAQRRTTITTPGGGLVEAVAIWVHLDPVAARPAPLTDAELAVWGGGAGRRPVKARLRHPLPPPSGTTSRQWIFRASELDLADHINNSAYWAPLEDELIAGGGEPGGVDAEIEYRSPAQPGAFEVRRAGERGWIVAPGGEVHAAFAMRVDM